MNPKIEFEEGKSFAWKAAAGLVALLFMKLPQEGITGEYGEPAAKVTLEQLEEAMESRPAGAENGFTFVFMTDSEVRYPTGETVVMEGGDVLFFLKPTEYLH